MNDYELVLDVFPRFTNDERELATRLVNRQPEAALLRLMLGLDVPEPAQPKPAPLLKGWCSKHEMQRRVRPNGAVKCDQCTREWDRRKRERRKEAAHAAQTGR